MADIIDSFVNRRAMIRHRRPALPLESRWYVVGGRSMHVRASRRSFFGDPTVVCVHGIGVSSLYMVPVAQRLAVFSKVYAPDLPGHGLSDKPAETLGLDELAASLARFIDVAGAAPVVVLGNSYGCQIAVRCAVEYPHLVAGVVLQGPTINARERTAPKQIYRWCTTVPREPLSSYFAVARDYLLCGPRRIWKALQFALDDPLEQLLPQVQVPALVVRGARDPIVPQAWAEQVTALLPDARLEVVNRAAHLVNYAAPDALAALVRAFVDREIKSAKTAN